MQTIRLTMRLHDKIKEYFKKMPKYHKDGTFDKIYKGTWDKLLTGNRTQEEHGIAHLVRSIDVHLRNRNPTKKRIKEIYKQHKSQIDPFLK